METPHTQLKKHLDCYLMQACLEEHHIDFHGVTLVPMGLTVNEIRTELHSLSQNQSYPYEIYYQRVCILHL